MVLAAALCTLALSGAPAGESELDQLIARTNELASFSATYTMTTAKGGGPTKWHIDYVAPGRLRIDTTLPKASDTITTWCVDGLWAVSRSGDEPMHGRVDYATVRTHLAELEKTVANDFPAAAKHTGQPGASVFMRWWFDDKTQKANVSLEASWSDERSVVLGWLATLRSKKVELARDGERFTFSSDADAFGGTLSAKTGFLEDFRGKSPSNEMKIHLDELVLDHAADAARFAVPSGGIVQGRDVSADLLRSFEGLATRDLRGRVYTAIAGAPGEPWDRATKDKIERVLQALNVLAVDDALTFWRDTSVKKRDGVAERLHKLAETKTPAEVAEVREKERGYLKKSLDELEDGFLKRLTLPDTAAPLARGDELLAIEHDVLQRVFDETVRRPTTDDFERATEPAKK